MHDNIKGFHLRGVVSEGEDLVKQKERLVNELEVQMRDNMHVPVLDLEPQFTREFDPKTDGFKFVLTIYGVKEVDSWGMAGISNGKMLKSTTPIKLSRS